MKKIFVVIIVCCLVFISKCYANPFVLTEKIPDEYIVIQKKDKKIILYFHAIKDVLTNELIYCIEPGVALSENLYEEISENDLSKVNLTKQQLKQLELFAYYGYGFMNQTDLRWYLASQMLIWEYLLDEGEDIYFTNTIGGQRIEKYEAEKNKIKDNMNRYSAHLEFMNSKISGLEDDEIRIPIIGGNVEDYEAIIPEELTAYVENEFLVIKGMKGSYELKWNRNERFSKRSLTYYDPVGQNLFQVGMLFEPISLNVEIVNGVIQIEKLDAETNLPISDTEFTLYHSDGTVACIGRTNEAGILRFEKLLSGKYLLRETMSQNAYYNDNYEVMVELSQEQDFVSLVVQNRRIIEVPDTFIPALEENYVNKTTKKEEIILVGVIISFCFCIYKKNLCH